MSKKQKSVPIVKILIDLDEYQRLMTLKDTIKKQENELKLHYKNKILPQNNSAEISEEKSGNGLQNNETINHLKDYIENLEKELKSKNLSQIGSGANDLLSQLPDPIASVDEQQQIDQFRPVSSVTIDKSKLNDDFDDQRLLSNIPSAFLPRATKLIHELNNRPSDISWDTSGVIFLDQKSLPDSDIYYLFPRLFRKIASPDKIIHLQEIATKIATMGLGYLINKRLTAGLNRTKPLPNHDELQQKMANSVNWWYIGDDN